MLTGRALEKEWLSRKDIRRDLRGYVARGAMIFPEIWPGDRPAGRQPGDLRFEYAAASPDASAWLCFKPGACGHIGHLLDLFRIDPDDREYAVFVFETPHIENEGWIRQARIVSKNALEKEFGIKKVDLGAATIKLDVFSIGQEINIEDFLLLFMRREEERFTSGIIQGVRPDSDGLLFGIVVERGEPYILRILSSLKRFAES